MRALAARRLALVLPTLLGVLTIVFLFVRLVPGDPVEIMLGEWAAPADAAALRRNLGLDRPVAAQYVRFIAHAARGDLGDSLAFHRPVAAVIADRYPATLELAFAALVVAGLVAIPLGAAAAVRPRSALDRIARAASLAGICIPTLWLGPLLMLVFSIGLGWLPVSGRGGVAHLVLPVATLALGMAGVLVRMTRATMLRVLAEDWVRTARAKGAPGWRVVMVHAFRNAVGPVLVVLGLQAGALLAGAIITETIFAWPGLGRLVVEAIQARDYPL